MEKMNLRNTHKNKHSGNYDSRNTLYFISSLYFELMGINQIQSYHPRIDQIIFEYKITELIQEILDICNSHYKSFKI